MIAYTTQPTIFAAPLGLLLDGILADVPRYESDKRLCGVARNSPANLGSVRNAKAEALQSKILDVLKAAPLVLAAIERKKMDSRSVTMAVDGSRSTVYESLHRMLDGGQVAEVSEGKLARSGSRCIEWVAK